MSQDTPAFHGFSLHLDVTVAPENVDKFLAAFKPCYEAVIAEPENTFFEVFQEADQPGHFRIVENWSKGKDWFMAVQLTKDYYKPYLEATESMWIKPREFKLMDRMAPEWTR